MRKPSPQSQTILPAEQSRPNIIVIVADDLGYNALSVYGGKTPTPHIDKLAAGGVLMTSGYVTAAVCAPSRAAILSGRQQTRFGFEFNPVGRDESGGMSLEETTIAETMKSAGYRTGMVGKWHLGQAEGYRPLDRGFDSFFGILGGATPFLTKIGPDDLHVVTAEDQFITRDRFPIIDQETPVDTDQYVTDLLTDRAIEFAGEPQTQPFFLYLAYTAPHTPLQASATYLERTPIDARGLHQRSQVQSVVCARRSDAGSGHKRWRYVQMRDSTIIDPPARPTLRPADDVGYSGTPFKIAELSSREGVAVRDTHIGRCTIVRGEHNNRVVCIRRTLYRIQHFTDTTIKRMNHSSVCSLKRILY